MEKKQNIFYNVELSPPITLNKDAKRYYEIKYQEIRNKEMGKT